MSAHWFYSPDGGRQAGPVTKDDIEGLLTRGELGDDALVWTEAMTEWRPVVDVAELHWARSAKSRLDGVGDPGEALKSFGKVGDLAGLLMASRKMLGYDLTFSWADFDRPVDELVQLIERYRSGAAVASSPPASPGA